MNYMISVIIIDAKNTNENKTDIIIHCIVDFWTLFQFEISISK